MANKDDAAPTVRFRGTVLLSGKTATGFEVPPEVVETLGSGRRPAVQVRIGGHTYPSTVAAMGGRFMLPLSAERREATGLSAGDTADVELTLDTAPREIEVPGDFAAALAANPVAKDFFDTLSYSVRQWHVLSVDGAKTQATRERRITKSVGMLAEHRKR